MIETAEVISQKVLLYKSVIKQTIFVQYLKAVDFLNPRRNERMKTIGSVKKVTIL